MLICLVKSVLNRWDSMPVVLDVRAKGRLSQVGTGKVQDNFRKDMRHRRVSCRSAGCSMEPRSPWSQQKGVAVQLRHSCQWGAERGVPGRKPPGLILAFTSWNLSFRNSLCVKSSCVCWSVFSTAKYPGTQLKGALSVLTHNSQQRKVNKCPGGVESGHVKGYLHQRRVPRDRHPPSRPHLLIYILYQFRNPVRRMKPCGPLIFSNPLTGRPTFTTRAFGVPVIPKP